MQNTSTAAFNALMEAPAVTPFTVNNYSALDIYEAHTRRLSAVFAHERAELNVARRMLRTICFTALGVSCLVGAAVCHWVG